MAKYAVDDVVTCRGRPGVVTEVSEGDGGATYSVRLSDPPKAAGPGGEELDADHAADTLGGVPEGDLSPAD